MGAAAGPIGQIFGMVGGERAAKGAKRGAKRAAGEFQAPASLQASGAAYPLFGSRDASVFQNLQALLSGNSLKELEPALRANAYNTSRQQRSFKEAMGRSGLVGSGTDLGQNFAINQRGGEQASNILAGLPALRRENIAAALPYFQQFMGDIARRQAGRAAIKSGSVGPNAAAKANNANTEGNFISSFGGKGGGGGGSV